MSVPEIRGNHESALIKTYEMRFYFSTCKGLAPNPLKASLFKDLIKRAVPEAGPVDIGLQMTQVAAHFVCY